MLIFTSDVILVFQVHFFGSIGGANVGACTRNILSQLLDNKLATKFNMQDCRAKEKTGFCQSLFERRCTRCVMCIRAVKRPFNQKEN